MWLGLRGVQSLTSFCCLPNQQKTLAPMKKFIAGLLALGLITALLSGCAWEVGGGPHHVTIQQTVGQQLIDLQQAKDSGAITDSEYQTQKAKVLGKN